MLPDAVLVHLRLAEAADPHPRLGSSPLSSQLPSSPRAWAALFPPGSVSEGSGAKGWEIESLLPSVLSPPNVLDSWECMKASYMKSNGLTYTAR